MAIINLPAKFGFTAVDFRLLRAGSIARSRYTGKAQRTVFPFAVWALDATLVEYPEPEASDIRAFLVSLEGIKNTFRLPVPGYSKPSGGYTQNALVNVAAASRATALSLKGMTASVAILKAGEYFTINDELKMATSDLVTDATGVGNVNFLPALRAAAALNAVVTLQNPTVLLHADEDDVASWKLTAPVKHAVKLSAIEAI